MLRHAARQPAEAHRQLLFSAPPASGKTEVARQLAYIMGMPIHRFDMSEYMERHAVSRLIGAPPGAMSALSRSGLLTEAITKQPALPAAVDDEKAHPDVFNILLQVMDHGTLTESKQQLPQRGCDRRDHQRGSEQSTRIRSLPPKPPPPATKWPTSSTCSPIPRPGQHHLLRCAGQGSHPARGRRISDAAEGNYTEGRGWKLYSPMRSRTTWPTRASTR